MLLRKGECVAAATLGVAALGDLDRLSKAEHPASFSNEVKARHRHHASSRNCGDDADWQQEAFATANVRPKCGAVWRTH